MNTIWQPDLSDFEGPKYKALVSALRGAVEAGTLAEGDKLPPVRDLAWRLQITPGTVARAYTILTDAGVLEAAVGRGTFVACKRQNIEKPLEIDVVPHNESGEDTYRVSLFSPHLPSVGQTKILREGFAALATDPPSGLMHYPNRVNNAAARGAVAAWLKGIPIGAFGADDIVLTHGGQNAILVVLQTILRGRTPTLLVEELSYPGFRRAAELLRARVVPVPMDDQGIVPEALATIARAEEAAVLCTTPEVHNPTGICTPQARRIAIADVAKTCDLQILEDDCYHMGTHHAPSYRMIAPNRSWYVSSISKALTPALRVGYALAPRGHTADLRRSAEHSFFGLATPMADLLAHFLSHPQIREVADAVRRANNAYTECAVNVLGAYELVWSRDVPFLWLNLPQGWRAGAFCQAAEAQGVQIRAAEEFACRNAAAPHAVRLAINAGVSLHSFEAAMQRLRSLLDNPPERISV